MPASLFKRLAGFSMAFEAKKLIEPFLEERRDKSLKKDAINR
jgi:hypothetical protein